jgi:hypothetical protein
VWKETAFSIKSNIKCGEFKGFLTTIHVDVDPHFLPQIDLQIHGSLFFARFLRESLERLGLAVAPLQNERELSILFHASHVDFTTPDLAFCNFP